MPLGFRHPFTSTGATVEVREAFESNADYIFDAVRRDALRRGDTGEAARAVREYLDHTLGALAFIEDLARATFGRNVPQVLFVHANGLNAACLDEMLDRLEARGYQFVTLEEAIADPAYATADGYVGPFGPSWVHRWRTRLGLESALARDPDPPGRILAEYRRIRDREREGAGR